MADYFIDLRIEAVHQLQKFSKRLLFGLFVTIGVDTKNVFALALRQVSDLEPGDRTNVNGD